MYVYDDDKKKEDECIFVLYDYFLLFKTYNPFKYQDEAHQSKYLEPCLETIVVNPMLELVQPEPRPFV